MKINSIIKISAIAIAMVLGSCHMGNHDHGHGHGGHDDHGAHDGHDAHDDHDDHEDGPVHLTRDQMNIMGIETGGFSTLKINDYIRATGTLGLPPNAYASVSSKTSGFIRGSSYYVEGSYIKKGVVLAYLENVEFISWQREYLETAAALTYLEQELNRQQTLADANAGVSKQLEKLQSEVTAKNVSLKALAKQLGYVGINADQLTADNITERIAIIAPMSGYITSLKMNDGMYAVPEEELMEVVSEDHLHLELDVFERDIAGIREGQRISYSIPALGNESYEGEVHVIGKEFNTGNKTVRVHGHLEGKRPPFIKDLFIEAKIWLNDQTVEALPEEALINDGTNTYFFATTDGEDAGEWHFEKYRVVPGTTDNGYTAVKVLDPLPEEYRIVVKGAYFVHAQSVAGELEHSH